METLYPIIGLAIAIWLLSSKQWRKSIGASATEVSKLTQQSLIISRASAYKEASDELGDIRQLVAEADTLLLDVVPVTTKRKGVTNATDN